jgi:hypothetical protein
MYIDWTKHIDDPKEKQNFERQILNAKPVLDRLHQMILERESVLTRVEHDEKSYESPSWSHLQAHRNGFKACAGIIKKYIDLDKQKVVLINP